MNKPKYGDGDASFKAAGEVEGIKNLVNDFYHYMDQLAQAEKIRSWHPKDLTLSRDKLSCFLAGWMGGPRLYAEKYGAIGIPQRHKFLDIGESERDTWLLCMQKALDDQPYEDSFKKYLMEQFYVPAERIRVVCNEKGELAQDS